MTIGIVLGQKQKSHFMIAPTATLAEAIALMRRESVGVLLVGAGGRVDGILGEREVVRAARALGVAGLAVTPVDAVMSRRVQACRPEDSLRQVASRMIARDVRHMPVIDDRGLRGVVSLSDIFTRRLHDALREVADGYAAVAGTVR